MICDVSKRAQRVSVPADLEGTLHLYGAWTLKIVYSQAKDA